MIVEKSAKDYEKKFVKTKTTLSRDAEKGLKQFCDAIAMHVYIPTSLRCVTQQQSGWSHNQ